MNIRSSHSKRRRQLRRFTTATLVALLSIAWAGPLHAVCACCEVMAALPETVEAEAAPEADMPACHKVASQPVEEDTYLSNSTQIKAPCGDGCATAITPPALTANPVASTIHPSITKTPVTTLARDLPLHSATALQLNRYESPPGIAALSAHRYAAIAPLLT